MNEPTPAPRVTTAESRIKIGQASATPAGMTLGDLFQFVQIALAAGADPRARIRARVGWQAQIRHLETDPQKGSPS